MRDHVRVLGGLYVAWAIVQAAGGIAVGFMGADIQPRGGMVPVALALAFALAVAFAVVGAKLWRGAGPAVRPWAIGLGVVALVSFPLGTALGIYALWTLLRRPRTAAI
jgi:hypothetical protein